MKELAEDGLARKRRNDSLIAHGGRIMMLHSGCANKTRKDAEKDGVAAESGIEETEMKHALKTGEQERMARRGCRGIMTRLWRNAPTRTTKTEPGHAGRRACVNGADKVEAGAGMEAKTLIKMPMDCGRTAEFE